MDAQLEMFNDILGQLNNNPKIVSSVVVSRSGIHIAGQPPEEVHLGTFIAMLAIILSATETAISGFKGELDNIFIELDRSRIIIKGAGNKALLAVVTSTKDNFDSLHAQIKKAVRDITAVI